MSDTSQRDKNIDKLLDEMELLTASEFYDFDTREAARELIKRHEAKQQLIGAIYTLEGIVNMNGILRMEPSTKQLRDHLDGLNEEYKKIQDKKEKL